MTSNVDRAEPRDVNIDELARCLRDAIEGEVRFTEADRALYSTDASNYRQLPHGVVVPRHAGDVEAVLRVCRRYRVPVLSRGGGTSQNGQCCNVAVVIDYSKYMNQVLEIDAELRTARVQPGLVCDALNAAARRYGLVFGPDPGTHSRCTLGGMIGNNSCGAHSVVAGKTDDNVIELEVLTADGERFWVGPTDADAYRKIVAAGGRRAEIYRQLSALAQRHGELMRTHFPAIRRRVSGYNIDQLLPENQFNVARALVGSEGTCVAIVQARVRLLAEPAARVLLVLGFADIGIAADATPRVMQHGPLAVEGIDSEIVRGLRRRGLCADGLSLLPNGAAWLFAEFGADDAAGAIAAARAAHSSMQADGRSTGMVLFDDAERQRAAWSVRETGASPNVREGDEPEMVVGWEDAAVDPLRLGDYLRGYQRLLHKYGYRSSLFGHFGDGCVHGRVNFDLRTPGGVHDWRAFLHEAAELVVAHGGSLSGEHGDGQAKAELLPIMYGEEVMAVFRDFKRIWDPDGQMNPRKLIDAYKLDDNLRTGPDYAPKEFRTEFLFHQDGGSFTQATGRCNGTAKCRARAPGLMCPSYRATGEERYSTRGRARLLFEMTRGEILHQQWNNAAIKEALDFCLACKGCKKECPTAVDMASYKAEFLFHYYQHNRRSRSTAWMARIGDWIHLAARVPRLSNWVARGRGIGQVSRRLAGTAAGRSFPALAQRSFRSLFVPDTPDAPGASDVSGAHTVLLWVDTFNNHFHPQSATAAVQVLRAAGYRVLLPPRPLCCGRPLYDAGMLDLARQRLLQVVAGLQPFIHRGIPLVGLEPACMSVFRAEALDLLGDRADVRALAERSFLLSEFLERAGFQPRPAASADAILHSHCHHKAMFDAGAERRLLTAAGYRVSEPEPGCCGMAGAFGFLPQTVDLSVRIGEQALLPAVRAAAAEALVVASGFSCREQIRLGSGRQALHLAEVLAGALPPSAARTN